jgi:hypothetical protein
MTAPSSPREAWDYAAFVRHYNEIAREFGGWNFDPTYLPEEKLRGYYESPIFDSLRDFARVRFQLDQQM